MQHLRSLVLGSGFLLPILFSLFLVPVLVLPWFVDAYEVHKATVVIVAAIIASMLFVVQTMRARALRVYWSWAFVPVPAFFLATVFSAFFSASSPMSWLGVGGGDYASVLFVGSCALVAMLIAQVPERFAFVVRAVRAVWGIEALGMFVLLVVLGISLFFGTSIISPTLSFGTPHALAIFFGVVTFLWMGEVAEGSAKPLVRYVSFVFLSILLLVAFSLDAWVLWLPLFFMGAVLFAFTFVRAKNGASMLRILPPAFLVIFPLVGWFLPSLLPDFFPVEVVPSFSLSVDILERVWMNGFGFLTGSGPGTYGIPYALHALPSVNATPFWNVVFERGFSHVLTLAPTGGIFVVLSFVAMQIAGVFAGFRAWARAQAHERGTVLGVYFAFLFLSLSAWTYAFNVSLVFCMFVLFGLLLSLAPHRTYTWSFASSAHASMLASFGFVIALVGLCTVLFITGTRYAAEIAYAQALALKKQGATPEIILAKVDTAASFNQWNDLYYRELSLLLLQRVNDLVAAQAPSEQVQAVLSAAVNAVVRATEVNPNVVANWDTRGNVYREVAPAIAQAADFSIASFITAQQLAPNNPLYALGLGRAYLAKADLLAELTQTEDDALTTEAGAARLAALTNAEEALLASVALKRDYTAAHYFLSAVYERQDKLTDAVESMEMVRALRSEDVGVGMQLSLLYLRQGKNDLAKVELERILLLSPTYANARWYLSVILEQEGDIEGAIVQVTEVLRTNPENEAVQQRLERLQSGEVEDDVAGIPEPLQEEGSEGGEGI